MFQGVKVCYNRFKLWNNKKTSKVYLRSFSGIYDPQGKLPYGVAMYIITSPFCISNNRITFYEKYINTKQGV